MELAPTLIRLRKRKYLGICEASGDVGGTDGWYVPVTISATHSGVYVKG